MTHGLIKHLGTCCIHFLFSVYKNTITTDPIYSNLEFFWGLGLQYLVSDIRSHVGKGPVMVCSDTARTSANNRRGVLCRDVFVENSRQKALCRGEVTIPTGEQVLCTENRILQREVEGIGESYDVEGVVTWYLHISKIFLNCRLGEWLMRSRLRSMEIVRCLF